MNFYDFATRLRPYVPVERNSEAFYVKTLFENIINTALLKEGDNPFVGDNANSDDTWRGYIKSNINSRNDITELAAKINGALDVGKFETFIYDISDDQLVKIGKDFSGIINASNTEEISEEIACLFENIINEAAARVNVKSKKKKYRPDKSFTVNSGTIDAKEFELLEEVQGHCPITKKKLIKESAGKLIKKYEIVSIYPLEFDLLSRMDFSSIEAPEDFRNMSNLIALSVEAADDYKKAPTIEMYTKLKEIKERCVRDRALYENTSVESFENNVDIILDNIKNIKTVPKTAKKSKWKAFSVDRKITEDLPLRVEVTNNVLMFYHYLKEKFQEMEGINGFKFNRLKNDINNCFMDCDDAGKNQHEIFEYLVQWVSACTGCDHLPTCRIFISFFVQNCEVFYESAK